MSDLVRGESEKLTINMGYVDLGRIDLLVREGFYANRSDFIRTAVRNQLAGQASELKGGMERRNLELGLRRISQSELEAALANRVMLDIAVVGLAVIANDVTPDLARATIRSLTVLGQLQADPAVRGALADRIR